jgi:phosphomannomutase
MTEPGDCVATTIVSSTLLERMARAVGVRFAMTLTGFKWVARSANDGVLRFGYEEALGFAVDPIVADKDGLSAALAFARVAHELAAKGRTITDRLDEIESTYGVHAVDQLAVRVDGPGGLAAIASAVERLRVDPPTSLGGIEVSAVHDLNDGYLGLLPTDGIVLALGPSGRVVVRPSGTEAKLKAYIEITPDPDGTLAEQRVVASSVVAQVRDELERLIDL